MPADQAPRPGQFEILYRSNGLSPLRMLSIVAMAFSVAGVFFAFQLLQAPVVGPMAPHSRGVAAAIMLAMGLGSFVAIWMYGRRIAARVALSPDGKVLRVAQPTPFGIDERDIPLADVACAGVQAGDSAGEQSLASTNLRVDVRGQRGFIIPLSGGRKANERLLRVLEV